MLQMPAEAGRLMNDKKLEKIFDFIYFFYWQQLIFGNNSTGFKGCSDANKTKYHPVRRFV